MMTRCKFRCDEETKVVNWASNKTEHPFLYSYKMNVVMGGSEENKKFWASSPSGSFSVSCIHAGIFEPGKEYYFDISEADVKV